LALLAAGAMSGLAIAHTWIDTSKPENQGTLVEEAPSAADIAAGYSGVYRVSVEAGQKIAVEIHDTQGCDAEIEIQGVTGDAAKVKAKLDAPLVRNQFISVKAKKVGATEATITVRGADVVNGTSGSCRENAKYKLVINVVASGTQATQEFGAAWRPMSTGLRSDLRSSLGTARTEIRSHIAALGSGSVDVETAAMSIYASAHNGLVRNQDAISTALAGYRTTGIGMLAEGGFRPECEPRGFGAGSGGPWDLAQRDTYLQGFGGLQFVDKEMTNARTQFDKLTSAGRINAQMTYQPFYYQQPAYSAPSQNPAPGTKSLNDLQFQLSGGITFQNPANQMEGCLWYGGRYDPARGGLSATLTDPFGGKITKTPDVTANGSFSVRWNDLTPGHTYRAEVNYLDNTAQDSCVLTLPWLDPR